MKIRPRRTLTFVCPKCGAGVGELCKAPSGKLNLEHNARFELARETYIKQDKEKQ